MNRMMTRDGSVAATRMRTEQPNNQPVAVAVMSARHNYKPHWRMVFIVYIFLLMQIFCMYMIMKDAHIIVIKKIKKKI